MEYDFYVCLTALSRIFSSRCNDGFRLVQEAGGVREVFMLSEKELSDMMPGGSRYISSISDHSILDWAAAEVDWAFSHGIRLLYLDGEGYPSRLKQCSDAPLMLYCMGDAQFENRRVLSVVGTRRATYYGRDFCRRILESLSFLDPKPLIISGLALGIDGCAHMSALDFGMETVAVLPCALDTIYPQRHRELALRIASHGALLTDFSRGTPVMAHTFVRRNRIIAGLSDATLLAESFLPGGGMITASLANSYNRDVFAVPGRNTDESFAGCNSLIASNSAILVDKPDSLSRSMGWETPQSARQQKLLFPQVEGDLKKSIVEALRDSASCTAEDLARRCGSGLDELSAALLEMELDGLLSSTSGGRYVLRFADKRDFM